MNKYLITYLFFLTLNCNAQISIDSLIVDLLNSYSKTGTREYLNESFTKFENWDKSHRYHVFLDSTQSIKENIGLSVVHYSFDGQDRLILIEGFNSKGERSYWDFPEIQKFRYIMDAIVSEMIAVKNEICNCSTLDTLSNLMIIEETNTNSKYDITRFTAFSKDSLSKLIFSRLPNEKVSQNREKVSYVFRSYDSIYKDLIIHERFYDEKFKLINGQHYLSSNDVVSFTAFSPYAYSIREVRNAKITLIKTFNENGELVDIREYGNSSGPINVPE